MAAQDAHHLAVVQADEEIHKPSQETAILALVACIKLHVTDWVTSEQEDPALKVAIEWISCQNYRISNTCWEMMQMQKRVRLFSKSGGI